MRWLIDGMNVIGSRPDGWWADRRAAMERFVQQLSDHASSTGEEITVVFDGEPFDHAARIEVAFAAGGPDAADDELVRIAASLPHPEAATVVTSDRRLAQRIRALGADVLGARGFRDRLEGTAPR
jgi:predicted RNA-binding protein with PIN domain